MRIRITDFVPVILTILSLLPPIAAFADCTETVARLVSAQGEVERQSQGDQEWREASLEQTFCPGDKIRTLERSRATLQLNNQTFVSLDQKTTVVFAEVKPQKPSWLDLLIGVIYLRSRTPSSLNIRTPYVNAAIKGTEFMVSSSDSESQVVVFEGRVETSNPQGQLTVTDRQAAMAKPGAAPQRKILLKPQDAVQWALYYPPLIDSESLQRDSTDPAIRLAATHYRSGDQLKALEALDRASVPVPILQASLLLSLGRVEEAERLLDGMPDKQDAEALALRSVIALARNDRPQAMELAEHSTRAQPRSSMAWTALSYAQQAAFDLEAALASARKAADLAPRDGLAQTRLAELLDALGHRAEAAQAAAKAVDLNPALARAWAIRGFAQLSAMDMAQATESFRQAIRIDSSDPLARFGLGLAKIRQGHLEEGTEDIEIAASLDPNDSLTRSYLGKAYYEQRRGKVAETEYSIAKRLDPKDPTPWFYDAIKKQSENRPIEAIEDMQEAIELNDNRGVYRSRQMLDDDLAARGAALGRIFNQVGFQRLGQLEAFKSLESSPDNYSAHRLLSDTYANVPRHEVARVSELLQSQLLQPINITPLQPQQAENNILTVSGLGPADISMNEFNPLFARNGASLLASGIAGSFDTYGNETVLTGIYNPLSVSLGQMHYQTRGFRKNNDIDQNLYTAYLQGRVTPDFDIQAEYRHRETEHGDLALRFAPTTIEQAQQNTYRRWEQSDLYRFGAHWSPAQSSDVIASLAYQDASEDSSVLPDPVVDITAASPARRYSGELQYIYRQDRFDAIVGGGYYVSDSDSRIDIDINAPFPGFPPIRIQTRTDADTRQGNAYAYVHGRYPDDLTWTLGVSSDFLEDEPLDLHTAKVNPKFGLTWQVQPDTAIRFAYFRTLRRGLIAEQTIEPVQVAGFNQLYDDRLGTEATRYGVALDHRFTHTLSGGIEASKRDLEVPFFGVNAAGGEQRWKEQLARAYLYWMPWERIAARLEYSYEDFDNEDFDDEQFEREGVAPGAPGTRTHTLPLTLSYFAPSGWFASLRSTYVKQEAQTQDGYQKDDFALVDTLLGYRLPKRWGIIQLEVRNLFDQDFRYQSFGLRTQAEEQAPFFPDRTVFGRVTLSF